MTLAIRTDSPEATIALIDGSKVVAEKKWEAGRRLSAELLPAIRDLMKAQKIDWNNLAGVIVFKGPGSFTGLRIGATVGNAIAYAIDRPAVGASGDDWIKAGVEALISAKPSGRVFPEYGALPNVTLPKN